MGYTKIVRFGDTIELYEYEKDIKRNRRSRIETSIQKKRRLARQALKSYVRSDFSIKRAKRSFFRLCHHNNLLADTVTFITLTYADDPVYSSCSRDISLFFKRLRKAHEPTDQTIKYYIAAEYGGETHRPHYHSIMFNVQAELIEDAWSNGSIHIGDVTGASVGYTLKYISKPSFRRWHVNDDRLPEFSLMSKRLGDNYLTPQMIQWHKNDLDNRMYCVIADGKKISMPRYYKDRIYNDVERKRIGLFARAEMISRQIEQYSTPDGEYNFADVDAFCESITGRASRQRLPNRSPSRDTMTSSPAA